MLPGLCREESIYVNFQTKRLEIGASTNAEDGGSTGLVLADDFNKDSSEDA
jgi:hypothetical protein